MDSSLKNPEGMPQHELKEKQSKDGPTNSAQLSKITDTQVSRKEKRTSPAVTPEKSSQDSGSGAHISQLDKEGSISCIKREGPKTPGSGPVILQSSYEGRTPLTLEKVTEDGYNWRKYGQKLVKGNEFIRSYYRCTYSGCTVKKHSEHSPDGKIVDILYLGQHDHPKSQPSTPADHPKPQHSVPADLPKSQHSIPADRPKSQHSVPTAVVEEKREESSFTAVKGKASKPEDQEPPPKNLNSTSQISTVTSTEDVKTALSESAMVLHVADNDEGPQLKRLKKGNRGAEYKYVDNTRLVVQTESTVDVVNDGYRWRKYGQKMVKGNANPRSYYRCSSPGCVAKKQVERASHDPKVVMTTYEGKHDHDMPNARTVANDANAPDNSQNSESHSKSGESDNIRHENIRDRCSDANGKAQEQLNVGSKTKTQESDLARLDAADHSAQESKSTEQQSGKSSAAQESAATDPNKNPTVSSVSKARLNDVNGKPKGLSTGHNIHSINPGIENKTLEQQKPNSEESQPVKAN